jgi:CDP-diacylglycerol--glycerol-3-phosphate 3-phosphatidyltransferase
MTTANKITIGRILLVPFFITEVLYYVHTGYEWHRWAAIGTFATAAVSDGIDGFIARHCHQRSELGAILDPLADKLLLVAGVVLLSLDNGPLLERLPIWLGATIISRDVLLLLGLLVIHYVCGKVTVRPRAVGKVATVLQMTAVLWGLFKWDARWLLYGCAAAAVTTGVSGLLYVYDGVRQLSASPQSAASSSQSTRGGVVE